MTSCCLRSRLRRVAATVWRALALYCLLPVAGWAQPVTVTSGEHGDFTRIAIVAPGAPGWSFEPVDAGYELRFAASDLEIELDDIFGRISRARIEDVAVLDQAPSGIRLDLSGTSRAEAYEDAPGIIVVDVRTAAPRPNPRREPAPQEERRADAPPRQTSGAPPAWLEWREDGAHGAGADADEDFTPDTDVVAETRKLLVQQLARAGAQGLLAFEPGSADLPAVEGVPEAPQTPAPAPPDAVSPAGDHLNVRAETAPDRDARIAARLSRAAERGDCAVHADLDISAWGSATDPAGSAARKRRAIARSQTPTAEAIGDLARSYLFLGFGAEARATLASFDVEPDEAPLLRGLAAILDEMDDPALRALAGLTDCEGGVAMWSLLAERDPSAIDAIDAAAVLREVSRLPQHLRRHLGPRVAERLLAAGRAGPAQTVRDAVRRGSTGEDSELQLLDARLDLARGRVEAAVPTLRDLVVSARPGAADAAILFVDTALEHGLPIASDAATAVGALAHSRRGTLLGAKLLRAEAVATMIGGDDGAAFAVAERLEGEDLAPSLAERTRRDLLGVLARESGDAPFLEHVFRHDDWRGGVLEADARIALADRLATLGFFDEVLAAVSGASRIPARERELRAQALIETGAVAPALGILAELGSDGARELRVLAHQQDGNHSAAIRELAQTDDRERIAGLAWRAGNWSEALEDGPRARREAVARHPGAIAALFQPGRAVDGAAQADTAPPALAHARGLVLLSRQMRGSLDVLLAD